MKITANDKTLSELFVSNHKFVIKAYLFIDVTAEDLESAYSIFGAMNNRGLPLSASDLIKNALLEKIAGKSVENQEVFNQKWINHQ